MFTQTLLCAIFSTNEFSSKFFFFETFTRSSFFHPFPSPFISISVSLYSGSWQLNPSSSSERCQKSFYNWLRSSFTHEGHSILYKCSLIFVSRCLMIEDGFPMIAKSRLCLQLRVMTTKLFECYVLICILTTKNTEFSILARNAISWSFLTYFSVVFGCAFKTHKMEFYETVWSTIIFTVCQNCKK